MANDVAQKKPNDLQKVLRKLKELLDKKFVDVSYVDGYNDAHTKFMQDAVKNGNLSVNLYIGHGPTDPQSEAGKEKVNKSRIESVQAEFDKAKQSGQEIGQFGFVGCHATCLNEVVPKANRAPGVSLDEKDRGTILTYIRLPEQAVEALAKILDYVEKERSNGKKVTLFIYFGEDKQARPDNSMTKNSLPKDGKSYRISNWDTNRLENK